MKISTISAINRKDIRPTKHTEKTIQGTADLGFNNTIYSKSEHQKQFYVSFGARLNRSPENFYAQEFNIENMPDTVKQYLKEQFDDRHHMPPAQLQREAFQYLELADTVEEIKSIYPDEPLFSNLRTVDETRPSTGILLLLKWDKATSNTPLFKDNKNKDLTVYLLKKVYLEGKTIDELNKDFEKDATDEIKKELGVKDGKFFSNTNLRTLGIRYPKLPYYNSFLATRNDKEYIPPMRKSGVYTVSDATKEKLSQTSKSWWAGLNEIERIQQIQKMMEGRQYADTVLDKYKGPIMTLAAKNMQFSEKLSQIFSEKLSDFDFLNEFPDFNERQSEIMLEFWNNDSEFRKNYSKVLKSVIADFDFAYQVKEQNPEYLEDLLEQALEQKKHILENAKLRRSEKNKLQNKQLSENKNTTENNDTNITTGNSEKSQLQLSSKEIAISFNTILNKHLEIYPKLYREKVLEFANKTVYKEDKKRFVYANDGSEDSMEIRERILENIHEKFDDRYNMLARTSCLMLAKLIYEYKKEPKVFFLDNYELKSVIDNDTLNYIYANRQKLDKITPKQIAPCSYKEAELFYNYLTECYSSIEKSNSSNIINFLNDQQNVDKNRMNMLFNIEKPNTDVIKMLQNYPEEINYIKNAKNDYGAVHSVAVSVIYDIVNSSNIAKNGKIAEKTKLRNPKLVLPILNAIDSNKNLNINPESIDSLKIAWGKLLNDIYVKYFSNEFRDKFLDYMVTYKDYNEPKLLILNIITNSNLLNKDRVFEEFSEKEQENAKEISRIVIKHLVSDFVKENTLLAKANCFALKQTLDEIQNVLPTMSVFGYIENEMVDLFERLKTLKDDELGKRLYKMHDILEQRVKIAYKFYQDRMNSQKNQQVVEETFISAYEATLTLGQKLGKDVVLMP